MTNRPTGKASRRKVRQPVTGAKEGPSPQARKLAAAILEVLAGVRTPTEAAQAIAVSVPRYYVLEQRALDALVGACEPRTRGPGRRPEQRIAELERDIERLRRECDRHQALARASQRTVGLVAPVRPTPAKTKQSGKKQRRQRRPAVRALRAVRQLQTDVAESPASSVQLPTAVEGATEQAGGRVNDE